MPVTIESVARQLIASVDSDAGVACVQWIIKRYEQLAIKAKLTTPPSSRPVSTPAAITTRFASHDHRRAVPFCVLRTRRTAALTTTTRLASSAVASPGAKSLPYNIATVS